MKREFPVPAFPTSIVVELSERKLNITALFGLLNVESELPACQVVKPPEFVLVKADPCTPVEKSVFSSFKN